jgi:hypothetical protein
MVYYLVVWMVILKGAWMAGVKVFERVVLRGYLMDQVVVD